MPAADKYSDENRKFSEKEKHKAVAGWKWNTDWRQFLRVAACKSCSGSEASQKESAAPRLGSIGS